MDLADTQADIDFRSELRTWLDRIVPTIPEPTSSLPERLARWQHWQRELLVAGYAGLSWPREHGGREAGVMQQAIFAEECSRAGAPEHMNLIGESFAGPTIMNFGTDAQRERFLAPILAGQEIWCQLFSEPGAGSDLAALETTAVPDGDGFRINGQKVWTSRAQIADYAILLARTTGGGRHRGITFFLLPMDQPGVKIRPLRHMLGEAEFNEVFLDDAYVPSELMVGELDGGWRVAMGTLAFERVAIATGRVNVGGLVDDLLELVRGKSADGAQLGADPLVRRKVAELYGRATLQQLTGKRILSALDAGGTPGPEASTVKLFTSPLVEEIADFAVSLAGVAGQEEPDDADASRRRWLRLAYQARGTSIAGGTTFIQRNIVAQRVLGMPRGR